MTGVRCVLLIGVSVAILAGASGCNWFVPMAVASQAPTEKVPAEFDKLPGSKAVVLVWADQDTLFDYPKVRLELGAYIGDYLKTRVKDVRLISPQQVEEYLERQGSSAQDPEAAGQYFSADKVIHVTLLEFSMRDREMAHFYRGRVRASVAVYDLKDKSGTTQRYTLSDAAVVYPEKDPVGFDATAAQVVRQKTYEAFADAVGRKFCAHERETKL